MSALERAKTDLQNGDYGLARQRLSSYLAVKGYDPEVLAELGRICMDMRDPYEAGRAYLASSAEGPDVDEAVAVFVRRTGGGGAKQAWSQLPHNVRSAGWHSLPPPARRRLEFLGTDEVFVTKHRPRVWPQPERSWVPRLAGIGCAVIVLIVLALGAVGIVTVVGWFW